MYKTLAIMTGVFAALTLSVSILEPSSEAYNTGLLQIILSLMLWDRSEK
jgi:hypothetical protein